MTYTSDKRLCVNADSSAVVDCDSPDAAFLLVGEGGELTDEQAKKYGLGKSKAAPEPAAEEKKAVAAPAENKAVAAPADTKQKVEPGNYRGK